MGKIITEKDFWMCSSGAMPAPVQGTRKSNKKEGGDETYITVADTATLSTIDFGCTKSMLLTAILTAIVVVVAAVVISAFIVATGGAGLGLLALVAIGAGGGIVGGIIGMVEGNMKCGQKNAQVRHWSDSKGDLLLTNTPAITSDCVMTCDVGGVVKYAPNIKTWNDAYMQAGLSYFTTFLECALGGAGIGLLGGLGASAFTGLSGVATLSQSIAFTWPTWSSIGINLGIMGAVKGTSGYNQYQRGDAWGLSEEQKWDMAIPEKEAIKRIQENGYQSITMGDVLLFGSDLIGPFINIKTAPSLAAAEARAAAQAKANPEPVQPAEPTATKTQVDESVVDTPEPVTTNNAEVAPKNTTSVKGNAFESPPKTRAQKFQESRDAFQKADGSYQKLPPSKSEKTVSSDGDKAVSGHSPNRISNKFRQSEGVKDTSPNDVLDYGENQLGHEFNKNSSIDNGVDGQASASHAEKQLMTSRPRDPIGVSRPMCSNCKAMAQKHADFIKEDYVVTDPDGTYIFEPGGTNPIFVPW